MEVNARKDVKQRCEKWLNEKVAHLNSEVIVVTYWEEALLGPPSGEIEKPLKGV